MAIFGDKYYAKTARKVAQRIVDQCSCIASKINAVRGPRQFRAIEHTRPYISVGIDWYEVAESDQGNTGGWSMIDPYQRFWKFEPAKRQTGESAARALMIRQVSETGAIKNLISDAHKSLVGNIVQSLCDAGQTQRITTHRWSPANGITERPHEYLGRVLRDIPEEERKRWDEPLRLKMMEFAFNACHNSSLGTSPFQMRYGYPPIFPFEADLIESIPAGEIDEATVDGRYGRIAQSLRDFSEAAAAASRELRELENQKLSDHGCAGSYEVGDKVWIFAPPQPSKQWNIKHERHWRPATVEEKLSNSYYKCSTENGRTFSRKGSLIRPNKTVQPSNPPKAKRKRKRKRQKGRTEPKDSSHEPIHDPPQSDESQVDQDCKIDPDNLSVGDDIITIDEPNDNAAEMARVTDITENGVHAHYYGTTSPNLADAKFSLAYIDNRGKTILQRKPRKREKAKPYAGIIPQDEELILGRPFFTNDMQLTTSTRRYLWNLKKKHKFMPSKKRPAKKKANRKGKQEPGGDVSP